MEQGILDELIRATIEGDDFFEVATGKSWDVKTASSESLEGKAVFDVVSFIKKLKDSLNDGENIILQISDLSEDDWATLSKELIKNFNCNELKNLVVIDAYLEKRTHSANQLLKNEGKA